MGYETRGGAIGRVVNGVFEPEAVVIDSATANKAAAMFDRARLLNDVKRQYTAAARKFAEIECLPGFRWINPV